MKPSNINDLRNELCTIFEELRSGKIPPKDAKELNNAAGKIIGSLKVQLEYCSLCEVKPNIAFLSASK